MTIRHIIHTSYRQALKSLVMGTSPQALARARERTFVKKLVAELEQAFSDDDIRVFSTYGRRNFRDFGAEKLLNNITVAHVARSATSGRDSQDFLFVSQPLWQIEIDFSRDWRSAIYAINRLNGGAAADKLLIGAQLPRGANDFVQTLRAPFAAGSGGAHLALIPHPVDWDESEAGPTVWRLTGGDWEECK